MLEYHLYLSRRGFSRETHIFEEKKMGRNKKQNVTDGAQRKRRTSSAGTENPRRDLLWRRVCGYIGVF